MHIGTLLFTRFFGQFVGVDEFGNRYYRSKRKEDGFHMGRGKTERRWVIYNGIAEPSKVPPEWHGWLHYIVDAVPQSGKQKKAQAWQKDHLPNLTGTKGAYLPPGHTKRGGKRSSATGDYQAWNPNE